MSRVSASSRKRTTTATTRLTSHAKVSTATDDSAIDVFVCCLIQQDFILLCFDLQANDKNVVTYGVVGIDEGATLIAGPMVDLITAFLIFLVPMVCNNI